MYEILLSFHSGFAYVALLLLIVAIVNSLMGGLGKRAFLSKDRSVALIGLIATHTQILIGLLLYIVSPRGQAALGEMKDAAIRLTSLEHPLINIIAVGLITAGWSRHKKLNKDKAKFKSIWLFYGIGLILILSRLPWKLWFDGV
jgi:hypothetical protein